MRVRKHPLLWLTATLSLCTMTAIPGCSAPAQNQAHPSRQTAAAASPPSRYVLVDRSAYDNSAQAVTLWVHSTQPAGWRHFFNRPGPPGERVVDLSTTYGVLNYAVSEYPTKTITVIHLLDPHAAHSAAFGTSAQSTAARRAVVATKHAVTVYSGAGANSHAIGSLELGEEAALTARVNRSWLQIDYKGHTAYVTANPNLVQVETLSAASSTKTVQVASDLRTPPRAASARQANAAHAASTALSGTALPSAASWRRVPLPPPGVRLDHTIAWLAPLSASPTQKQNSVIEEARSKLGTPYIWGHNEDRGQYGFDCGNFTAYVYHHALGYRMSGASRSQAKFVGVSVPVADMRRGDLVIFEYGKHVGIYAGNHRMIQGGGGLGKVGYLSIGPGSYWGKHITDVKRMF